MRKPIYGNVPVSITEEQIAEMRELYAKIRHIKYSHAYAMLTLGDTTKEERGFFASVGDINNGRSYVEEQVEVEKLVATIAEGNTWDVAKYEVTAAAVEQRARDLPLIKQQRWIINELRRQIQQLSAIEKSLTTKLRQTAEDTAKGEAELLVPIELSTEERRIAEDYAQAHGKTLEVAFKDALFEKFEKDLTFRTDLTMEQVEQTLAGVNFFSELKEGLEEALAYSKGRRSDETEELDSLDAVMKSMSSEDLRDLLKDLLNVETSEQVADLVRKILQKLRNRAPEMTKEDWELIRPIAQRIFHPDIKVDWVAGT